MTDTDGRIMILLNTEQEKAFKAAGTLAEKVDVAAKAYVALCKEGDPDLDVKRALAQTKAMLDGGTMAVGSRDKIAPEYAALHKGEQPPVILSPDVEEKFDNQDLLAPFKKASGTLPGLKGTYGLQDHHATALPDAGVQMGKPQVQGPKGAGSFLS